MLAAGLACRAGILLEGSEDLLELLDLPLPSRRDAWPDFLRPPPSATSRLWRALRTWRWDELSPWTIDHHLEACGWVESREQLRARGVYPTPERWARRMSEELMTERARESCSSPRIGDPACGLGGLLWAAAEAWLRATGRSPGDAAAWQALLPQLAGAEISPWRLRLARVLLWSRGLRRDLPLPPCPDLRGGDALLEADQLFGEEGWDVVVANPPFIRADRMARQETDWRARVKQAYPSAQGNWDLFVPFAELCMLRMAPRAAVCLLLPARVLSVRYAQGLRELLLQRGLCRVEVMADPRTFSGAQVPTVLLSLRAGSAQAPVRFRGGAQPEQPIPRRELEGPSLTWPLWLQRSLQALLRSWPRLEALCTVRDGCTTGEAYRLRPLVREQSDAGSESQLRLVNSGLIDPFLSLWGQRAIRYLGGQWERPVVSQRELSQQLPRLQPDPGPRILVAGLCQRVEAVVVDEEVLCGKSASQLSPQEGVCPHALAAWLNSSLCAHLHHASQSTLAPGRHPLHCGPGSLRRLPCPPAGTLLPGGPLSRLGVELSAGRQSPELLDSALRAVLAEDCPELMRLAPEEIWSWGSQSSKKSKLGSSSGLSRRRG